MSFFEKLNLKKTKLIEPKIEFKGRFDITPFAKDIKDIPGGACEKGVFKIGGQKFVYKQNFERNKLTEAYFTVFLEDDNITELHNDFCEVVSYHFLKEFGCDFALPYYLASYAGHNGCISPFFGSPSKKFDFRTILQNVDLNTKKPQKKVDENFGDFHDFNYIMTLEGQYEISTEQVASVCDEFCKRFGFEFDKAGTQQKLNQMVMFDFFLGNHDRTWFNVVFMEGKKDGKKTLSLAPIFDNGEALGLEDFDRMDCFKEKDYAVSLGISENGRLHDFEDNNYFQNQQIVACDIFQLAKKDKTIAEIVEKYKKFDFSKFLDNVEKECEVKIPKNIKSEMEKVLSSQREVFCFATQKLEKRLKKPKQKAKKLATPSQNF